MEARSSRHCWVNVAQYRQRHTHPNSRSLGSGTNCVTPYSGGVELSLAYHKPELTRQAPVAVRLFWAGVVRGARIGARSLHAGCVYTSGYTWLAKLSECERSCGLQSVRYILYRARARTGARQAQSSNAVRFCVARCVARRRLKIASN